MNNPKTINYNLNNISAALTQLNHPEQALKNVIHFAGTNGKGSTLHYVASGLEALGYRVGTYTSPHLIDVTERFQINGAPISKEAFENYYAKLERFQSLTEFEKLTCVAFLYFKETQPDYLLLETGLGGRLDATNVAAPLVSVITHIDLDHQDYLGHTIQDIATEKAGIIKPETPVFTPDIQHQTVLDILQAHSDEKNSPLILTPSLQETPTTYQAENKGLALATLQHLFPEKTISPALFNNHRHWGRLQQITHKNKPLIIDAAHNPSGINALTTTLQTLYPNTTFNIICSFLKTKDITTCLQLLAPIATHIYYCPFSEDAYSKQDIEEMGLDNVTCFEWPNLNVTLEKLDHILITGSIYFLGEIKLILSDH